MPLSPHYHTSMDYQAKLTAPFGVLGIRCSGEALTGIDFLPASALPLPPANACAARVCDQLRHYFADPVWRFDLPLALHGSPHQMRVWQALQDIPCGHTLRYGELAARLHSAAQAVGQACGANPIPIVVPCHRVVGKAGLGGFMRQVDGASLDIKRWLLAHEGIR